MKNLLNKLSYALNELSEMDYCPRKISDFYNESQPGNREKESYFEIFGEEPPFEITDPLILPEQNDVVSINVLSPAEEDLKVLIYEDVKETDALVLQLISIEESSANLFIDFLRAIPYLGR
ncbi:MAG: hypothetical protein ACFE7R_11930, partial [Candidatus Hodarchaeota archaeon]